VRQVPERERAWTVDRFVPMVESLAATPEGKRDLAAICAAYLREHRPETTVKEPAPSTAPAPRSGAEGGKRRSRKGRSRRHPGRR